MRPLWVLLRISLVGILWSVLFIEGIRVILLTNWHFDIFRSTHWVHAWNLWRSGWIIDESKEWAFILIIITAIPVWITVWAALSAVNWENICSKIWSFVRQIFYRLFISPFRQKIVAPKHKTTVRTTKTKEALAKNPHYALENNTPNLSPERRAQLTGVPYKPQPVARTPKQAQKTPAAPAKEFSHSLFELSDEDNFEFDLFDDNENKSKPLLPPAPTESKPRPAENNNKTPAKPKKSDNNSSAPEKTKNYHTNSTFEVLKQKGYEIISGVTIAGVFIDFVGVSKNSICLCLNDKESGDWLADEELFNDEEPLWFSESSHRVSPVYKIITAQTAINEKLTAANMSFKIIPFVIEQIGSIINTEDMFDIWKNLHVNVTRIDRGAPKEIPLFAKKLEDVDDKIEKSTLDKLKKLLRNDN